MASDLNKVLFDGSYGHVSFFNGIQIQEISGRSGTDTTTGQDTAERTWRVSRTTNPQEARAALRDGPVLINQYDGLFIESLSYEQGPSYNSWDFTANYSAAVPAVGGYTVSIDTTGATILQTSSYGQTRFPAPGTTAPDFLNAIDVQDGAAQGIERIIPALKINVRAKIDTSYITSVMAYVKLIASLTGTTNSAPMFDNVYAAGELLFAGASGEVVAEEPQLTFTFLGSSNVTGATIGGIPDINKLGHDYLWFLFDYAKDATTGMLISKPRAAYVDKIYGPADLSVLGIGVTP